MKTTFYKESLVRIVNKEDLKKRILEDPDFIKCAKSGNSLNKFLASNKEDLDTSVIARVLMISEDEVENIYQECIDFIKSGMLE